MAGTNCQTSQYIYIYNIYIYGNVSALVQFATYSTIYIIYLHIYYIDIYNGTAANSAILLALLSINGQMAGTNCQTSQCIYIYIYILYIYIYIYIYYIYIHLDCSKQCHLAGVVVKKWMIVARVQMLAHQVFQTHQLLVKELTTNNL